MQILTLPQTVGEIWLESMRGYAGLDSVWDAARLASHLAHGSKAMFAGPLLEVDPDCDLSVAADVCADEDHPTACDNYCKAKTSFSAEQRKKMAELLVMGTGSLDMEVFYIFFSVSKKLKIIKLEHTSQVNPIPACHNSKQGWLRGGECWGKVINEEGICYTTSLGGYPIISEQGQEV